MNTASNSFKIFARAIIQNNQGEVLMLKKHENQKIAPGLWVLPGGAIEFGEFPEDALARELFEEVHFSLEQAELIASETRIINAVHWLGLIYKVIGSVDNLKNGEPQKHSEIRWCDDSFRKQSLSNEEYKKLDSYL